MYICIDMFYLYVCIHVCSLVVTYFHQHLCVYMDTHTTSCAFICIHGLIYICVHKCCGTYRFDAHMHIHTCISRTGIRVPSF